jgi:hypothetical protein
VKVRTRHATRRPNQANDLSAIHRISNGHQRLAHVEVGGDYPATVVNVYDISRQKKIIHQRDDAPVGDADLFAFGSAKIDAQMSSCQLAVEHSA